MNESWQTTTRTCHIQMARLTDSVHWFNVGRLRGWRHSSALRRNPASTQSCWALVVVSVSLFLTVASGVPLCFAVTQTNVAGCSKAAVSGSGRACPQLGDIQWRPVHGLSTSSLVLRAKEQLGDKQFDEILGELEAAAAQDAIGAEEAPVEEDPWADFKETFGWVLVADIFIIITLSLWFLAGVFLQYIVGLKLVLDTFFLYWDPYFQSLLGILFGARLTGIAVSTALGSNDDD
mmetsp:Transcript_64273/g.149516  ORF Transcript_64273/g.149516 Transcript_64273/m.149516 type:complete len:234 (-) Transcript_64273:233-934(-)|eukprot:CAMPEP_0171095774 /NCGR_PEP_ID=MMETSP0766_2-20121228/43366_1 /TAXON_ID=439317 /ORGANISM="Gambierdiscus australes, Strain CAWD 149" /LENGTH=233 /DNA_ID=CAMNT_0011554631 /DNA_START=40 /DNA_END=741 /DNA_ORIENTATION=+